MTPVSLSLSRSFLTSYQLPALHFAPAARLSDALRPTWDALHRERFRTARKHIPAALQRRKDLAKPDRAALLAARGVAEMHMGDAVAARASAQASLQAFPAQWLAHRVVLSTFAAEQDAGALYRHLVTLEPPGTTPAWDEPLSPADRHLALASAAWQIGDWEAVATELAQVHPEGVETMPAGLQEDWFRLALYRDRPEDAMQAAAHLVEMIPADAADAMLQALVQQGWMDEALPLYRSAFDRAPSPLLHRRLVALYIRTGALEEARRLSARGPLKINV